MGDAVKPPEHYLRRAEEVRTKALGLTDPGLRRSMLRVAEDYEMMAKSIQGVVEAQGHLERRKSRE
jgi:hypothetical protein